MNGSLVSLVLIGFFHRRFFWRGWGMVDLSVWLLFQKGKECWIIVAIFRLYWSPFYKDKGIYTQIFIWNVWYFSIVNSTLVYDKRFVFGQWFLKYFNVVIGISVAVRMVVLSFGTEITSVSLDIYLTARIQKSSSMAPHSVQLIVSVWSLEETMESFIFGGQKGDLPS